MKQLHKYMILLSIMVSFTSRMTAQFANTSLSNLGPTAVNSSLLPASTNTIDLGSSIKAWRNIYLNGNIYLGGVRSISNKGTGNFFAGPYAGILNGTGYYNAFFGTYSGYNNNTGTANTFIGYRSGYGNVGGHDNTFVGSFSGHNNTTGTGNTFSGWYSGYNNNAGNNNTYTGNTAFWQNNGGHDNSVFGYSAGYNNISGNYNTIMGSFAGSNTTSSQNCFFGYYAANENTSGYDNTIFGTFAGYHFKTGYSNAVFGKSAGYNTATGDNNSFFGNYAGLINNPGNNNTYIGYYADGNSYNYSNSSALGAQAKATASNQVMLGANTISAVKAAGDYVIYSDGRFKKNIRENVPGLEFINQLRPVTYTYDIRKMNEYISPAANRSADERQALETALQDEAIAQKEKMVYTGFVAQEVEKTVDKLGYDFSGVYKPQNEHDPYGLSYSDFVVPLAKAVQELSKSNNTKDSLIHELQDQLQQVLGRLTKLERGEIIRNEPVMNTSLGQNTPNPFRGETRIAYTLQPGTGKAVIVVTNAAGQLVQQHELAGKPAGNLKINSQGLAAGTYFYTLLLDGKQVGSRQMVLTK